LLSMKLKEIPNLLYADSNGKIFDDPDLHMSGHSGSPFSFFAK
jgi:hypothetical protein